VIAILMRELRTYFKTPIGYIFMGLFLLVSGFFFTFVNLSTGSTYFTSFLQNILFLYLFAIPLLTMRLISEERRSRTDQLLLTSPITVTEIVLGKFLAAFFVYAFTLLVTVSYAIVVGTFGDLWIWETVGGYVGILLLGSSFIAVGVFVSALSENQVSAAFFTFFALLLIWFIDLVKTVVPGGPVANGVFAMIIVLGVAGYFYSNTGSVVAAAAVLLAGTLTAGALYIALPLVFSRLIINALSWFSLLERFNPFTIGLLRFDAVVFYVSFTSVFLYLTVNVIEKRRWA